MATLSERRAQFVIPCLYELQLCFEDRRKFEEVLPKQLSNRRNKTAIRKLSSCPDGYITIFICYECGIVIRRSNVFCPKCKKTKFIKSCKSKACQANQKTFTAGISPYCYHLSRVIDREQLHAFYFPPWAFVTDIFMHLEEHLVDYTRREIAGSIKSDERNDSFSAVSSLNFLSINTQLKEEKLVKLIEETNRSQLYPQDHRGFLNPDYNNSFEKKLKELCMFTSSLLIMKLFLARFKEMDVQSISRKEKEMIDSINEENGKHGKPSVYINTSICYVFILYIELNNCFILGRKGGLIQYDLEKEVKENESSEDQITYICESEYENGEWVEEELQNEQQDEQQDEQQEVWVDKIQQREQEDKQKDNNKDNEYSTIECEGMLDTHQTH